MEHAIPKHWIEIPLNEVCEILDSIRIPINSQERAQRIKNIPENDLYPYYGATGQVGMIDGYLFEGEHVLVGEDGAPFLDSFKNKAYLVGGKFWVNNHAHILRSNVSNKYLCYYLNQVEYSKYVTGTTRLKLNQAALKLIPVKFAPRNEQNNIVAKIEELFSELDKGIENLKTARAQLKVYRQAVLKHAFEGKLTAKWREENKDKLETAEQLFERIRQERETHYLQQLKDWQVAIKNIQEREKPPKPNKIKELAFLTDEEIQQLPELPNSWMWQKLGQLTTKITDGEHFRPSVQNDGVYFLSAKDVRDNGISFADPLYICEEFAQKARLRCNPEKGDILIVSRGATVGRMCVVDTDEVFCLLGSVILVKFTNRIKSGFLLFAMKSPFINVQIISISGATAQQAIYLRDIQHIPIPLCSQSEQSEITQLLEQIFSSISVIEAEIDNGLKRAEALRQSILKKAFSGQLVAQDPNDEPATLLLERIRSDKELQKASRKKPQQARGKAHDLLSYCG